MVVENTTNVVLFTITHFPPRNVRDQSVSDLTANATSTARPIGIIASRATALPTPSVNREAAMIGEKTVAMDCDVVLRPSALPIFPPLLSVMRACMIGKMEALKNPILIAPMRSSKKLNDSKNKA